MDHRPIGDEGLGDFAREQIRRARRDPRLDRDKGAAILEFWDAIEEAERVLFLGELGLHELVHTLDRHERELGVKRDDPDLDRTARATLQAAWERAESARIEIGNGHPFVNGQALLAFVSALDALVEDLARSFREFRVKPILDEMIARARAEVPEASAKLSPEVLSAVNEVTAELVARKVLGRAERLYGSGADRYERVLTPIGLAAPVDRQLPQSLKDALTEAGAIRDVLMHRAGRIDLRAMRESPTLRYKNGELVRVTRDDLRRYAAAVRCYAQEIGFRGIRSWPEVTDADDGPRLEQWAEYYSIGM